jgi:hypothetical protein
MTPPWTVEYWLFRPSAIEAIKNSVVGIRRRRVHFRLQYLEERKVHTQILQLREQMTAMSEAQSTLDKDGVNVQLFRREALIQQLTDLTSSYEDAAVRSERLAKLLLISISSALGLLEVLSTVVPQLYRSLIKISLL